SPLEPCTPATVAPASASALWNQCYAPPPPPHIPPASSPHLATRAPPPPPAPPPHSSTTPPRSLQARSGIPSLLSGDPFALDTSVFHPAATPPGLPSDRAAPPLPHSSGSARIVPPLIPLDSHTLGPGSLPLYTTPLALPPATPDTPHPARTSACWRSALLSAAVPAIPPPLLSSCRPAPHASLTGRTRCADGSSPAP